MKLSNQVIAEISRLLQVAILTGTDVVDNLRMIEVEESDGMLVLTEGYRINSEHNIERLVSQAQALSND